MKRESRWIDPAEHEIFKLLPSSPPMRHEIVLVDDERCRVLRAKVTWDGPRWTLHKLKVKPA